MKKTGAGKGKLNAVEQLQQKPPEFLIVGIGASAGGIQALQQFFKQVPPASGMAYVVILHLSPDHDSQLAGILQQSTEIPVAQVKEKTIIQPNHIYVVPPDRHLAIEDDYIAVLPNIRIEERRAPVDIFFRSLADQHGPRAIGVILSGTGANGSMGIKRIKERGGAIFVQNPREAEFNEMPRNSIATELVDEVLNVGEIPAHIIAYRDSIGKVQIIEGTEKQLNDQQQALRDILTQLKARTGHDFSNYKRPTLMRRIERRISVRNLPNLAAYAKYLQEDTDEPAALLKDLLISVTNFFRDKKAFDAIEQDIIPLLFENKNENGQVRVWVAGCATGEEAYSFAMLCLEATTGLVDAPKIQIFASDIDEGAIARAREGYYTINDLADVSPERLRRFFSKEGDGYRIRREVRAIVMFAVHNFLKDPPFSHIGLISCRNVMIYLNNVAQKRVIDTFHFALNPGSYLFLGNSETVDATTDLYAAYSRENHIYQSRQVAPRAYPVPDASPTLYFDKFKKEVATQEQENKVLERISFGDLHQQLLEEYAPPSLVVNEEFDILHLTERAGKYLQVGAGVPSSNLLKLVKPELRLALRSALYQAAQQQSAVDAKGLKVSVGNGTETINVLVRPVLRAGDAAKGFMLIVFEPTTGDNNNEIALHTDEPVARQLEEELVRVKTHLRASNEQHDFQAEEMKASNEELQAMNEELRSSAEELETSREELQSINEELRTVNQELKVKIEETNISGNNLQNLINSTNVGTIFLDRGFAIRLFTPAILDIFNLKSGDYGRPVTDITHKLQYDGLLKDAETVLEKLSLIEREVSTTDNRFYLLRMLPYRTAEDRINGVVVTFVDITTRKETEEALRRSEEKYRLQLEQEVADRTRELRENYGLLQTVYNTTLVGMSVIEPVRGAQNVITDFRVISANKKTEQASGGTDITGRLYSELFTSVEQAGLFDMMVNTLNTGEPGQLEHKYTHQGVEAWYATMFVKGDNLLVRTDLDITERKQAEEERSRAYVLLQQSEELAGIGSWDFDLVTGKFSWSDGMYRLFNLQDETEISPDIYLQYATADCRDTAVRVAGFIKQGGAGFDESLSIKVGETIKVIKLKGTVVKNWEGHPTRVLGIDMDVTAARQAEEKLRQMEAELQQQIFRVTLRTQEEERRRISESLHNGLGQMLYGVKISLSQLSVKHATENPAEFEKSRNYTSGLLSDAIRDSRRISHELMPAMLEEFGLKAAVKDVCRQMQNGVKFRGIVELGNAQIDNYMQLALFRTLQELMLNVVKHAQATRAQAEIRVIDQNILIQVSDNGQGINPEKKSKEGIGLASIQSKADLLNGTLDIESTPGKGTVVKVFLPYVNASNN